jgi:hypothetical protein
VESSRSLPTFHRCLLPTSGGWTEAVSSSETSVNIRVHSARAQKTSSQSRAYLRHNLHAHTRCVTLKATAITLNCRILALHNLVRCCLFRPRTLYCKARCPTVDLHRGFILCMDISPPPPPRAVTQQTAEPRRNAIQRLYGGGARGHQLASECIPNVRAKREVDKVLIRRAFPLSVS